MARVWVSQRALDLAVALLGGQTAVFRCVRRSADDDYHALKTMIAEGPFTRAVLVYCDPEQPHLSDEIESWFIGDIEHLAERLAAEASV